ncbi:MAG: glutamate-cysteine ligase family protein [Gemmatimonadales bacterium]
MGQHDITTPAGDEQLRRISRALLDDVEALDRMCASGAIEPGLCRIGAEQEMFLVHPDGRPALLAQEVLRDLGEGFTTELALFNIEYNLQPLTFENRCLSEMERRLNAALERARGAARALGGDILLAGTLPSLEKQDLDLASMTPLPRYQELNRVMSELSGGKFRTQIKGIEELALTHDNVLLEACNTSFQIHLQIGADHFARAYNLAQVVTAPVLAAAANSPLLLQHKLWRETRVAMFEQSLDVRSDQHKARGAPQRVSFGDNWVDHSVTELFKEDIARFRLLLRAETGESSLAQLERGEVPKLRALALHNGTIYRWNRACYGVLDGKPNLRIENRVLPSGPTVLDEVANAAFFFGLMVELGHEYGDVRTSFTFPHVKANFQAAARYGLHANFRWADGETYAARPLLREVLLPYARAGLARRGIPADEIDRYLGVIEGRVATGQTGAQWTLDAADRLSGMRPATARYLTLTRIMLERQRSGEPVHTWAPPQELSIDEWRDSHRVVGQVMTTDLFTVHPEDLVDVAASVMRWRHLRHVPVEDEQGHLVGMLSHRTLLGLVAAGRASAAAPVPVREVMKANPITATPDMPCLDALALMREHKVGCLPVVKDGMLVGVVSERDFLDIAFQLFERYLKGASAT